MDLRVRISGICTNNSLLYKCILFAQSPAIMIAQVSTPDCKKERGERKDKRNGKGKSERERERKSEQTSRSINHGNWSRWQVQSRSANLKYVGRKNWFRRTCTVRRGFSILLLLLFLLFLLLLLFPPFSIARPFSLAFCNAVDTHDHSKKLDEMKKEKEKGGGGGGRFPVIFLSSVRWWNTSFGNWLGSHRSDITTAENSGAEKEAAEEEEKGERERWTIHDVAEKRPRKKERVKSARRVGRTEQTDRSLIYGDYTSDIWTGSRRKFGTPRLSSSKCIERCPAACLQREDLREVTLRALSYELNSVFLLSRQRQERWSLSLSLSVCGTTGFMAGRWDDERLNIWLQ